MLRVWAKFSPIALGMAAQKLARRLIGTGQSVQSAGRGNDLTERKKGFNGRTPFVLTGSK